MGGVRSSRVYYQKIINDNVNMNYRNYTFIMNPTSSSLEHSHASADADFL